MCSSASTRAGIEQIEAGLKSRTQEALAERGYDAGQVNAEIAVGGPGRTGGDAGVACSAGE